MTASFSSELAHVFEPQGTIVEISRGCFRLFFFHIIFNVRRQFCALAANELGGVDDIFGSIAHAQGSQFVFRRFGQRGHRGELVQII